MSDYTPNTDRVRAAVVDGALITQPEFDRWLEKLLGVSQPELANAWEDGHKAGTEDTWNRPYGKPTPNPYRPEESNA